MEFVNEYPEFSDGFNIYLNEEFQFTSIFYRSICDFARLKKYSLNSKIVQNGD